MEQGLDMSSCMFRASDFPIYACLPFHMDSHTTSPGKDVHEIHRADFCRVWWCFLTQFTIAGDLTTFQLHFCSLRAGISGHSSTSWKTGNKCQLSMDGICSLCSDVLRVHRQLHWPSPGVNNAQEYQLKQRPVRAKGCSDLAWMLQHRPSLSQCRAGRIHRKQPTLFTASCSQKKS